jgi:hypothetical protein
MLRNKFHDRFPKSEDSDANLVCLIPTGVHFNRSECNTAISVIAFYALPGVRVIHSYETFLGAHQIR